MTVAPEGRRTIRAVVDGAGIGGRGKAMIIGAIILAAALDMLANWLASRYLIPVGMFLVPAGTFCFALSFTLCDAIRRFAGRRATIAAFGLGFTASMVYAAAFGGGVGRIAIAGLIALLCSSTTDYFVQGRTLRLAIWRYVGISNAVSLAIDTLVFSLIAFAGNPALLNIILGQYLAKLVMTVVAIPAVYQARRLAPAPALGAA